MTNLADISLKVRNYKCFASEEQGYERILPINLIIGRNNTGKSALLEIVGHVISNADLRRYSFKGQEPQILLSAPLRQIEINQVIDHVRQGNLDVNNEHQFLTDIRTSRIQWTCRLQDAINVVFQPSLSHYFRSQEQHSNHLNFFVNPIKRPFGGLKFRRLSPDRDIKPEVDADINYDAEVPDKYLNANGTMATTLFQQFLNREDLPRELVEKTILDNLNLIFSPDGYFTRIFVRQIVVTSDHRNKQWEIDLEEKDKGSVRVTDSGHGLKTILLVLANLFLVPRFLGHPLHEFIFGFEELENNMHPALYRRLLMYLRDKVKEEGCHIILTSHSHVAIDLSVREKDIAQILHVTHNGEYAEVQTVTDYMHHRKILDELDVRASDLLQSNCVVWVEGPSDRLYFNRWMELFSDDKLKEGVHYQCTFYGGKLLSQLEAIDPWHDTDAEDATDLVNLMKINKHAIVLMDSDQRTADSFINTTKQRIVEQITEMQGLAWVTEGREVENYLPQEALEKMFTGHSLQPLAQYEDIKDFLDNNVKESPKRSSEKILINYLSG